MAGLIRDVITFIKTLVIFLPIQISCGAVLLSIYNQDFKAIPFLLFALLFINFSRQKNRNELLVSFNLFNNHR